MTHIWLAGWYATRLHAVDAERELPNGQFVQGKCGAWVVIGTRTARAQKKLDKGVPHCKRCEKLIGVQP